MKPLIMHQRIRHYFFALVLVLATATPVLASVTYEYVGPAFNDPAQTLTSPYHLTIELTTPALLSTYEFLPSNRPDLLNIEYLNLSWSQLKISDGLSTIYGPAGQFSLSLTGAVAINGLDSYGLPTEWSMGIDQVGISMFSCYLFHSISDFRDQSIYADGTSGANDWTLGAGGHWSISQVPEPATLLLLVTGMACLAAARFRMNKHDLLNSSPVRQDRFIEHPALAETNRASAIFFDAEIRQNRQQNCSRKDPIEILHNLYRNRYHRVNI